MLGALGQILDGPQSDDFRAGSLDRGENNEKNFIFFGLYFIEIGKTV